MTPAVKKVVVEADDDVAEPPSRKKAASRLAASRSEAADLDYARGTKPTASGDRSLIRALGLKIGKDRDRSRPQGGHDTYGDDWSEWPAGKRSGAGSGRGGWERAVADTAGRGG